MFKWDTLGTLIMIIYCDVPGSPCPSKTGPVYGPFFFLKCLDSVIKLALSRYFNVCPPVNGPKDPWPHVLSLPGALSGLLETPPRRHVTI